MAIGPTTLGPGSLEDLMERCTVHHCLLSAQSIFGSVGRSGGGYNTVWRDWTPEGRQRRELIMAEYEQAMDRLCGHYAKLEASMLQEGMRNPIIVTCGAPRRRKSEEIPPEVRNRSPRDMLIMETLTGGSRLWVAQKHNMAIPCLINDWTGRFANLPQIVTVDQALKHYRDPPLKLSFDRKLGLIESFDKNKIGHHLGAEWSEDRLVPLRAPIWVSIMNRHGYRVDRLPPFVEDILRQAGIDQSSVGR